MGFLKRERCKTSGTRTAGFGMPCLCCAKMRTTAAVRLSLDEQGCARCFRIVGPLSLHICENIERTLEETEQASARSATAEPAAVPESPAQPSTQPDSPAIDAYLPDDSPGASNLPTQHPHAYERPSPLSYAAQEPAAPPLQQPSAQPAGLYSAGGAHQPPQQHHQHRPASAPHPQEDALLSRATAIAAEAPRPASVNGNYDMRGRPSSSEGSGGSGGRNPAHNRLYADYFSKQSRLEEERRLRYLCHGIFHGDYKGFLYAVDLLAGADTIISLAPMSAPALVWPPKQPCQDCTTAR
jgi:hypothetical protein